MKRRIKHIQNIYKCNRQFINKTPLQLNKRLSQKYECNIYLKREDLQEVRSFKIRGAYNKLINLSNIEKKNGIVCASAGNHAQGVALSCNNLEIVGDIFIPDNTPKQKIKSIKRFMNSFSNLHIVGENFDESLKKATDFMTINNKTFIHPFDDDDIINGQATIGVEIFKDINPDIIIGTIGGGGLMGGISMYSKYIKPSCLFYGVEPDNCNAMYQSIQMNKIITLKNYDNFVDGAAVKRVGDKTFKLCKKNIDDILLINNGHLCNVMLELYMDDGIITEPAGALPIASLDNLSLKGKNVVIIISGGNNDITRYPQIQDMALRYIDIKHYFIIEFTQKSGELKKFANNILDIDDDITRFEYIKKTNKGYGQVLIGIETDNVYNIKKNLNNSGFKFIYLNNNDLLMSYLV